MPDRPERGDAADSARPDLDLIAQAEVLERTGDLVPVPRRTADTDRALDLRRSDVDAWGRSEHIRQLTRRLYDPIYKPGVSGDEKRDNRHVVGDVDEGRHAELSKARGAARGEHAVPMQIGRSKVLRRRVPVSPGPILNTEGRLVRSARRSRLWA